MKEKAVKKWARSVGKRLKEPSTWAGLGVLAMVFGVDAEQVRAVVSIAGVVLDQPETVVQSVTAAAGAAAVLLGEKAHDSD